MGFECPSANFKSCIKHVLLICFKKPILVTMSREATTDYLNNILSVKKLKFL